MTGDALCIFGEVLFDHFPEGERVLGGAPFNVAWHLQAFGRQPCFISRIGNDAEGKLIRDTMGEWGMNMDGLQTDHQLPTGRVAVHINNNEPSFDIVAPCAYDAIEPIAGGMHCRILYHGSLALREKTSSNALASLKAMRPGLIFVDVNLRLPWWRPDQVDQILHDADWVKLNTDEMFQLYEAVQSGPPDPEIFMRYYNLKGLVLTRGEKGATVLTDHGDKHEVSPTSSTSIVDTVGAGDAFSSVMMLGLTSGWELPLTLQRAQDFASAIVGQRGATSSNRDFYQPFIKAWCL